MADLIELKKRFARVRSLEQWERPEFSYASVEEFECSNALPAGIHSIVASGLPIDLYLDIKPGCPMVFFFNGAKVRSDDLKLPIFAGLRVLHAGDVSRIYINDPSLYLQKSLSLGWYAGSRHLQLQNILPRIITHAIAIGSPGKVMFTGGSGGGFASLFYSRLFPDSLALVWNPQTDILKFYSRHIREYGKAAFDLNNLASTRARLPDLVQTDLCPLYASAEQKNFVLYLQNYSDEFHVNSHLKPFLASFKDTSQQAFDFRSGKMRSGLYVYRGHWGEGHATPPHDFLRNLYRNLVSYEYGWDKLFAASDLEALIGRSESTSTPPGGLENGGLDSLGLRSSVSSG